MEAAGRRGKGASQARAIRWLTRQFSFWLGSTDPDKRGVQRIGGANGKRKGAGGAGRHRKTTITGKFQGNDCLQAPVCRSRGKRGMRVVLIATAIIALIAAFLLNRGPRRKGGTRSAQEQPGAFAASCQHALAFISNGKLFYQAPGQELRELQSPHVRTVMDRMERRQQLHGWKEGTAFSRSFSGGGHQVSADAVAIQATSAQFLAPGRVLYFLRDSSFGGLFEYDLAQDTEKRLLHKQYLYSGRPPDTPRWPPVAVRGARQERGSEHRCNGRGRRQLARTDQWRYGRRRRGLGSR